MLHNLWYQDITSLLDYISELPEQSQDGKRVSVLCPDPSTADKLRERLGEKFIVQTISAGLKGLMTDNDLDSLDIYRKSELIFELWIAWKKFGMKESFFLFNNCFNLVTELRGYSTNTDQVIDLLKEANEELFKGVCFLLRYYQERKLQDENSIYQELSKADLDFSKYAGFVVYGFKHLSANQIDMLVNFSEQTEVFVPLPSLLQQHLSFSDWPAWLKENGKDVHIEASSESAEVKVVKANDYLASQYIHTHMKNNEIDSVYFWDRSEAQKRTSELSSSYLQYKKSIDLFKTELHCLEQDLLKILPNHCNEVFSYLEQEFEAEKSKSSKNYRKIKVFYEFYECLKSYQVFGVEDISQEDLKVLLEKTRLDLPRNSLVNEGLHGNVKVGTFSDALIDTEPRKLFVLSGDLNFDVNQNLDDHLLASLASLGPIRNLGLDFLITSMVLNSLSHKDKMTLVISDEVFEKTTLFDQFKEADTQNFEKHNILDAKNLSSGDISEPLPVVKLSPSKLQKFLDCPYQFYLSRIEELNSLRTIKADFLAAEAGTLSHDVLAKVVPKFLEEKEYVLPEIISEEIKSLGKQTKYAFREIEMTQNCTVHAESALAEFSKIKSGELKNILPEETFQNEQYKGILDLYFETINDEWFLFDYKKSDASIPNQTEVLKGRVVQLTLYSKLFEIQKFGVIGYICLEKPHKSMFYYNPNSVYAKWMQNQKFYEQGTWLPMTIETLTTIQSGIDESREALFKTTTFSPLPRKNGICSFCDFSKFCTGVIDAAE